MMTDQSRGTKALTTRYIIALSTIAILAIIGQILIQLMLMRHTNDGRIINIAGRQRMLSQRLAKDALALRYLPDDSSLYLSQLDETLALWTASHTGLQQGNAELGLPGDNSAEIDMLFAAIEPEFNAMQSAATCLLVISGVRDATGDLSCTGTPFDYVTVILDNEAAFLTGMDAIVFQYDDESRVTTILLSRIEYILLAVILIVLLLEGRLIFRPAITQIENIMDDLYDAQQQLWDQIMRAELSRVDSESARAEAEQSNRVKSAFLASMSHELRTPLNAIINFTKFVAQGDMGPVNEEQQEVLMESVDSARHLLSLINDVLDMSKIEAGSLTLFLQDDVDVRNIIEQTVSTSQALLEGKPVIIETDLPDNLPLLRADRQRLRQVMLNLLSNACKFTDAGTITVSAWQAQQILNISVADTGDGIAEADHPLVFEAFKQTDSGLRKASGTGLGMPITRSLVEAHGGEIMLESIAGQGTTFTIRLPLQAKTQPAVATPVVI